MKNNKARYLLPVDNGLLTNPINEVLKMATDTYSEDNRPSQLYKITHIPTGLLYYRIVLGRW